MTTPPRLAPILAQFEFERGRLLDRLVGLTDAEYLWEPVPGCWSIRPRAQVTANRSYGSGDWQLERAYPEPDPAPSPPSPGASATSPAAPASAPTTPSAPKR